MENYYQKYKLSSLHFGAYYSGNQYFFPSNTLSELDFNRYNNPYYIDFLDLPKTGKISLFNYLEPIYDKTNISGSDKIYSLPSRTDTINIDLAKIKRVYAEKNSSKDLSTSINYFGNNLSFVLSGANLYNNEWSNEEDLNLLINQLNFAYSGNIDYPIELQNNYNGFYGKGYLLKNCSGCIDKTELIKTYSGNAQLDCKDCLENQKFDVIKFSINLNYNIYNLLNENDKKIILNSEKIDPSYLSKSKFITFIANDKDLQDAFSIISSNQTYVPFNVCENIKAIRVSAGNGYSIAVLSDGRITGWGLNDRGQIDIPAEIGYNGAEISAGTNYSSLALLKNGTITGWGFDWSNGFNSIPRSNRYSQIGNQASGISEGFQYSLVLLKNGRVTGWGDNSSNQALGGNNLTGVKAISAGTYNSLALLDNSRITGWGNYSYYEPAFDILTGVIDISAGPSHSLALLNNGRVTGWGNDTYATTGGNNLTGITGVKKIFAGTHSSLILFKNGQITGWGSTIQNSLIPPNLTTNIAALSTSQYGGLYEQHFIVSLKDGTITGWGDDTYKQVSAAPTKSACINLLGNNFEFYRDKNYLPLFFRNLNLNSKKLVPFVEDQYGDNYVLNQSGYKITSYKYVPNIDSQKVFGSRIIDENSILSPRDISLNSYSKTVYDALFSGNEVYQYGVSENEYIPQAEQIQEKYFKYGDVCGNYYLIPRKPVQIRLTTVTGQEAYLNQNLSSGANLGYSLSINGSGDTIIATAPNATFNNVQNAGLIFVVTGNINGWSRAAKITGWDSSANDQFGFSSCINKSGTLFAIGAPNARVNDMSGAGAVYIFTGKNQNWSGIAKITGSSSYSGDKFGSSLSMNSAGNVLIAGAPRANNLSGSAYIFTGNGNGWAEYNKINKRILNIENETGAYFGYSVSMNNSGNLVAIGAPNEISGGFVYIYNGNSYQNQNWSYTDKIFQGENYVYYNYEYYENVCSNQTGVEKISIGEYHYAILLKNGMVRAMGINYAGEANAPYLTGIIDISAGNGYTLALDKAGRVTSWGYNRDGMLNIPTGIQGNVIQGNVAKISASKRNSNYLLLLKNGFLFATGGGANVFPQSIQGNVTGIYAGYGGSTVLLKDGTITGWEGFGNPFWNDSLNCPPSIQGNIKKFNTIEYYSGQIPIPFIVALLNDGRVTGWGANGYFDTMKSFYRLDDFQIFGERISTKYAENIADISSDGVFGYFFTLSKDGSITGWFDSGNLSLAMADGMYPLYKNVTGISDGIFYYSSPSYTQESLVILKNNNTLTGFNNTNSFGAQPILSQCSDILRTGRGISGVIGNSPDSYFGYSVDLNSGNIIAVGAPGYNDNKGSCNIYDLNIGNIIKTATLNGNIDSGFFGASVALNSTGNVLIVGSPFADISGNGVTVKAAGLSSAFINKTGWELYNTRSNFLSYEYLGSSVAINDTGNIIVLGAIGTPASNGNVNAGNYYISAREQTCPNVQLLDENPTEEYTIPNIKVQLDAMDGYSLDQDQPSITYWKNKVNFGKGYNNLYNDGDAITFNSDIELIEIQDNQFSGLLDYNNPKSGDYISFNNKKFVYPIDFSGITGLNNLINNNSLTINKINSKIINDTTLLLSTSGSNEDKNKGEQSLIVTNYLSGSKQAFAFYHYLTFDEDQIVNLEKQAHNIKNIYSCRHSKTGEINSSYRDIQVFINERPQKEYILAILNNGKITGFGTNESGRLIGSLTSSNIFSGDWNSTPVGKITGAVKLSLGSDFALALLDNKKITGWGNNFSGKATFGNALTGVIDISAGANHSLALLDNGRVTGWGDDSYGQAFGGNSLIGVSGISAGWLHSLALLNNSGKITGWGYDGYGQITSGINLTGVKEISAGKFHSLAILSSGNRITGWGDDYCNQLTQIHNITYSYNVLYSGISQISLFDKIIFMLNTGGYYNGVGNDTYNLLSQQNILTGIKQVGVGSTFAAAILNNNKITGWGDDAYAQISSISNLTGVRDISIGNDHGIAILIKDNKITGWGYDYDGKATSGNNLTGVSGISAGWTHSMAVLLNGNVTGWGSNDYNESNGGDGLTGVIKVAAGFYNTLALLDNKTITGWGNDGYDQVSIANSSNLTGVIDIANGYTHSLALLDNGRITGWGNNTLNCAIGGNNLTGVKKIQVGNATSIALLQNGKVTGWGNEDNISNLFNIALDKKPGPTGLSGISAGLFSSYAFVNDNKKITGYGFDELNINLITSSGYLYSDQIKNLPKYNFAHGVNSLGFIIENQNSGSMIFTPQKDIRLNSFFPPISPYIYGMKASNLYTAGNLQSGKYSYSLTGSGFYNAVENYPDNDDFLPKYQTAVMLSSYFTNLSTMIITGYTGSLPISLFFVEYGLLNSNQKTIQSYKNTGCYISTLNTGKLINLTGIGDLIKINQPFYSDIQVGNLIMDTNRFEYYINNRLIYTGSTGFNFGQIVLGNNYQYTGIQPVSTYDTYQANLQPTDLTGIQKGFNGNLFEVLIYNSALNELNRNEVFYYLANKWQTISNYYPSTTIDLTNKIILSEKTKTNCSDCSPLLNNLPKQNEPHILLFEYNLYGYSGTMIQDCDLDMQVYILNTGFYEQARKEPLASNLEVIYITGNQKSISTINARSQNVYNVADFNFGYNKILPSQDRLKTLKSTLKLQQPVRMYTTGEYLKYPKIDGNGI